MTNKHLKWQWRKPFRRLWILTSLLLATATVSSDEILDITTTEPPDWENETIQATTPFQEFISRTTESVPLNTIKLSSFNSSIVPSVFENDAPVKRELEFKFTRTLYNGTIPENSPWKTNVIPDEKMGIYVDNFENIRFKITNGDREKFFKAEERLVGNFCFLVIRTRTNINDVLNRERKDKFTIEVKATGIHAVSKKFLEANTTVAISILDVNDLKPLFFQSEYEKKVPEDMPLHKSIIEMHAEDADLGKNGEIYYSFFPSTEQFAIHPTTGIVSLTRPLKYQEKSLYELSVVGQDRGQHSRVASAKPSTAKLKIKVKEVNLHVPEIYVHKLPELVENSNTHIYGLVRVIDKDEGIHGLIKSLEIVDGDPDGHFRIRKIDNGEYNIEIMNLIDRETHPRGYNLTLKAIDKGIPPRQSFKSVTIKIADLNDNAPVFDREIYEVNIPETSPINTPVIRLKVNIMFLF